MTKLEDQIKVFKHFAWQLAVSIVLCLALNIGYIYLMSRQTELMVKISIVGIELTHIALIGYGIYLWHSIKPT